MLGHLIPDKYVALRLSGFHSIGEQVNVWEVHLFEHVSLTSVNGAY